MRMNWWLRTLLFGLVMTSVSIATAVELPGPVVYLRLDGDLTNSGSGGSAYDGVLETSSPNGGAPIYAGAVNGRGIQINPALSYPYETADVPTNNGNNIAVTYTLSDEGTIALWYNFAAPHYNYQQIFNNSGNNEQWEAWADAWEHDGGRGNCMGARAGGYYADPMIIPYTNGWHHVTLTWARQAGDTSKVDFTTYYDGVTTEGAAVIGATWADPGDKFLLGGNYGNSNGNGTWDDVRIYDVCLTSDQVVAAMNDTYIPGDANNDGKVDGSDVTILAGNWQKGVSDGLAAIWTEGDFNSDGKVDGSDVTILAGNWQYGVSAATTAVPEPSIILLFLAGLLSALLIRRNQ